MASFDANEFLLGGAFGPDFFPEEGYPDNTTGATTAATAMGILGNNAGAGGAPSSAQAGAQEQQPELPGRRCFVTVGATAGFRALLEDISSSNFLQTLASKGFTTLDVQCGPDLEFFRDRIISTSVADRHGVTIRYFGYTDAMNAYVMACRGERNVRLAGCVISHGGTGTVLEVQSVGAPLIVVANPTLMDNHQVELAEELEQQNSAVHGHIGNLPAAIERIAQRIVEGTLDALPPYTPPSFPVSAAERITLFDWMVLTCYPDELDRQQRAANLGEQVAETESDSDGDANGGVNGVVNGVVGGANGVVNGVVNGGPGPVIASPDESEGEELIDLDEANLPLPNGIGNGTNGQVNGINGYLNGTNSEDDASTTASQTAAQAQYLFEHWDGIHAIPSDHGDHLTVALTNGNTNGIMTNGVHSPITSESSDSSFEIPPEAQELFDNWDGDYTTPADHEPEPHIPNGYYGTNGTYEMEDQPEVNGYDGAEVGIEA